MRLARFALCVSLAFRASPPEISAIRDSNRKRGDSKAIAALHATAKALNKAGPEEAPRHKGELLAMAGILGLLSADPERWFTDGVGSQALTAEAIEQRLADRLEARARKDFAEADSIRDELQGAGILLEDGPDGTSWRRA